MAVKVAVQQPRLKRSLSRPLLAILALILALVSLGISATIPFTMPSMALMVVRIGASELSMWLIIIAIAAAILSGVLSRVTSGRLRILTLLALTCALLAVALASIPLVQLPDAITKADAAMRAGLGSDYSARFSREAASDMRSTPFSLSDYFLGINANNVQVTRDLPYRIVAGHALLLDRYDPPATKGTPPHPGLLIIHGGSWRNGDKGEYAQASLYLASRGYVVYDIQYRLSAEARFPAQLEDAECALGYMRSHASADNLDPESVIVAGRSAGAHLALLAAYRAARDPIPPGCDRLATVRGAVAFYPPTDLTDDYINPAQPDLINSRQVLGAFIGGSPTQLPDKYMNATPQHWMDHPVPPTLLFHGESDQIVLPRNTSELASSLRASSDKVVTIFIPWAGHGYDAVFQGPASQISLYYWERFMAYALGGK